MADLGGENLREGAIASLIGHLARAEASDRTFPELSKKARRALAELIVSRNGYMDLTRNHVDAVNEAKLNSEVWTYYGFAGGVRRFIKKCTGQKL